MSQEFPEEPDSGSMPNPVPPPELFRVAWVVYLVLAIAALIWIGIREGGIGTSLLWADDLHGSAITAAFALDVVIGLGSAVLIVGLWEVAERSFASARAVGAQLRTMLSGLTPSEAVGLAVLSGVSEELFFRGAVQGSWTGFNGWAGWAGATALFAVLHSGPGKHFRWWTGFAAVAGGLMGFWFLLRGNLVAPVVAHVAVNGFQLVRAARRAQHDTDA